MEVFNNYIASNYSSPDCVCVNESISRWYGLGEHWINTGIRNYITMDWKSENDCETQYTCDGRSKIMIQLKLVKGVLDNEQLVEEIASGLHGTIIRELDINF